MQQQSASGGPILPVGIAIQWFYCDFDCGADWSAHSLVAECAADSFLEKPVSTEWDHTVDVLIIGSGAGAMTAAIRAADAGARVLVVEKTDQFGGNSAMSGGVLWLPNSPLCNAAGGDESRDKARQYMQAVVGEEALHERIDTYLDTIPEFINYLHTRTHLRLDVLAQFPDMYPDVEGSQMHRCHEARPFHGKLLGDDLERMRAQHPQTTDWLDCVRVPGTAGSRGGLVESGGWHGTALCVRPAATYPLTAGSPPGTGRRPDRQPVALGARSQGATVAE
jgi:hypothetical protein